MRIWKLLAATATCGVLITGVARAADTVTTPAGDVADSKKPVIKIVDAGAEPRTELRYEFKKGQEETYSLVSDTAMEMAVAGQKINNELPITKMKMKVTTTDVTDSGDAKVAMEIVSVDVEGKPSTQPQVLAMMKQQLQSMQGLKGTSTVSSRGEVHEAKFEVPPNATPEVQKSVKGAEQQMQQMSALLPKEPVGQGAKWETTMPVEANGLKVDQTVGYTMTELTKEAASFKMTMTQTGENQEMKGEGIPPGMMVEKFKTDGTGTSKIEFSRLSPADYAAKMAVDMTISQGGQQMSMHMKIDVTMKPE